MFFSYVTCYYLLNLTALFFKGTGRSGKFAALQLEVVQGKLWFLVKLGRGVVNMTNQKRQRIIRFPSGQEQAVMEKGNAH